MLTPSDIQRQEFSSEMRGYNREEVNEFLDLLTLDFSTLIAENEALSQQIARMEADIEKYRNSENVVLETLEAAKSLMSDISGSAEKKADLLIKNAELDAELIKREAKESAERMLEEMSDLSERLEAFKIKYKNLLEAELERFDSFSAELFKEFKIDDLKEAAALRLDREKNVLQESKEPRMVNTADIFGDMNKGFNSRSTVIYKQDK